MLQTSTFWDGIAEKYARRPVRDPAAYEHTLERTRSYLGPDDRVLELGCGTGSTALILAGEVGHLTASDYSAEMIRIAREKAERQGIGNVDFRCADVADPALGPGPYDAVLAFNLLHLLEDLPAALRQIGGLLKSGGYFISKSHCLPEHGAPLAYRALRLALPVMQWLGKAPYVRFMTIAELEEIVAAAGFEIVEVGNFPAAPPNRFIVARKPAARASGDGSLAA